MKKQTTPEPGKQFSLDGLLTVSEGTTITVNKLRRLDLYTIPRNATLRLSVDALTVLIHRDSTLQVRLIFQVSDEHPWAKKYGAKEMARAMSEVTGQMPEGILPLITASAWVRPSKVSWEFSLPLTSTGKELLTAVQASVEPVKIMALGLLLIFS